MMTLTREPLSVSELNEYVKTVFSYDPLLKQVAVRGEISNFKRPASGHLYFSLKDSGALIRCVMFRQYAYNLRVAPRDGMQVVLQGYVSLYTKDGQYQFYAEGMLSDGIGSLYTLLEKAKEKLRAKGYFDEALKKSLPASPKRIGVVTSETGAVIRDIIKVARRRDPAVSILLVPVKVQGDGAAQEIATGIRRLQDKDVDVIICGRGGGSLEDLWAFNEEVVADAIHQSTVPVISAVGHETDFTIADLCADVRAATPSQAAELAVPDRRDSAQRLDAYRTRLTEGARRSVARYETQLRHMSSERLTQRFEALTQEYTDRLTRARTSLHRAAAQRGKDAQARLSHLKDKLVLLDPQQVLKRGYTMVRLEGEVVQSVTGLHPSDAVQLVFHDGQAQANVESIQPKGASYEEKAKL